MLDQLELFVYRRLDDRLVNDPDSSDSSRLAWNLHRLRAAALHDVFDEEGLGIHVIDWGHTDDEDETHELVQLLLEAGQFVATTLPLPAIVGWIGGVLSSAISDVASEAVKRLITRLRRKQEANMIADFTLRVGAKDIVTVYPDDLGGEVVLNTPDGRQVRAVWSAPNGELPMS